MSEKSNNTITDKINNFKWKVYDKIREVSNIEPTDYLENSIKTLINEQDTTMLYGKYINCLGTNQIQLSHRLLLFFDIIRQINININSILCIMPFFWHGKKKISGKNKFIQAYNLHLCKELEYKNIIYNEVDLEKTELYNDAYSPTSLSVMKFGVYDFIYIEFISNKKKEEINYKILFDNFIKLYDTIINNLRKKGSCLILISKISKEILTFIELLINKNIFTSYRILQIKHISVISYLSKTKFILLSNYTGNNIYYNGLYKYYKDYHVDQDILYSIKTLDNYLYDAYERIYYEISIINKKDELQKYIYNNILEYCNNIEIFIGSKYVNERKINIWKNTFNKTKISNVLYNTDNDINLFFTYILNNKLKSDGTIYTIKLKESKLSKNITNYKFINNNDIDDFKTELKFDIIYISDSDVDKNSKYIFMDILKRWQLLKKNGFFVFDNLNDIYYNYKNAFEIFQKLFYDEINIQYSDFSHIILKKL